MFSKTFSFIISLNGINFVLKLKQLLMSRLRGSGTHELGDLILLQVQLLFDSLVKIELSEAMKTLLS